MSDKVRRTLRTWIQSGITGAIVGTIASLLNWGPELTSSAMALSTGITAFILISIEEKTGTDVLVGKGDGA